MKTTIDIADPLLLRAERLAAKRGTTLEVVIEEALRDALAKSVESPPPPLRTHVVHGRGLQPGLSWDVIAVDTNILLHAHRADSMWDEPATRCLAAVA